MTTRETTSLNPELDPLARSLSWVINDRCACGHFHLCHGIENLPLPATSWTDARWWPKDGPQGRCLVVNCNCSRFQEVSYVAVGRAALATGITTSEIRQVLEAELDKLLFVSREEAKRRRAAYQIKHRVGAYAWYSWSTQEQEAAITTEIQNFRDA